METIGKRIINLRESLNMKQKDLALSIGVTKATMCKYENDQNIPNADTLKALSIALNTTADYLIGSSDIRLPYDHNYMFIPPKDKDLIQLILSLSHDNKIRIAERALILRESENK